MEKLQFLIACLIVFASGNQLLAQCTVNVGADVTVYPNYAPLSCATLTAYATGQAPLTIVWSTGNSSQSIQTCDTAAATYVVTVTDSTGCTASDTVQVQVNAANLSCHPNGRKVLVCHVPPGNPPNAHNICISENGVPAHLAHGDYLGTCVPVPPSTTCSISLGADTAVCLGSTITLDAGAAFTSYMWSDSSTGQMLTVTTAGTYRVTATDSSGCSATDQIDITIDANALQVDAGIDQTKGCADSCITLSATVSNGTPPFVFLWSSGDSTASVAACDSTTATYIVNVTDSSGCTGSDDVTVSVTSFSADAAIVQAATCNDSCKILTVLTANGTPPYTYSWNTGETTDSITVCDSVSATYHVTVVDSSGCSASDSITVAPNSCGNGKVQVCHFPSGNHSWGHTICISENALSAHLHHGDQPGCCNDSISARRTGHLLVLPNPAHQKISIEYSVMEQDYLTIDLYSISGKKVASIFKGNPAGEHRILDVDLIDFPQGMYVAEVKTSGGELYHQKFMLLK